MHPAVTIADMLTNGRTGINHVDNSDCEDGGSGRFATDMAIGTSRAVLLKW